MQKKRNFYSGVFKLLKSYWFSEEKWKGLGLLLVVVSLNLGMVFTMVRINDWYKDFYDMLQNYEQSKFWIGIATFLGWAFIYVIMAVYSMYLRQKLQLNWRNWLTKSYLSKWIASKNYYKMQVLGNAEDNPDQRISEDINLFTSLTLQLSLGLLRETVTLVAFIVILWQLSGVFEYTLFGYDLKIPGYMVWLSLIYATCGTILTVKIGRPLVNLNYLQQRREADFRFGMMRLRENSESIAFYKGETNEEGNLKLSFTNLYNNFIQLINAEKRLTWFTAGYGQLAVIFPLVMSYPMYFAKKIQIGGLMQIISAFGRVQDALSFFVDSYSVIAEWQAVCSRLIDFTDHMDEVEEIESEVEYRDGDTLILKDLTVKLPNGNMLSQNINMDLNRGQYLLITGRSGQGKSTLLRLISGIWPFGDGRVILPEKKLFLSQRPYLPLGTLRQAIIYPGQQEVSLEVLEDVLNKCRLENFINELDRTDDWSHIMSLGEQQRLAFARILIQKPDIVFLDEATSALDEPTEKYMYRLLGEELPKMTVVSVGHRSTLLDYHDMQLKLYDRGQWDLDMILNNFI